MKNIGLLLFLSLMIFACKNENIGKASNDNSTKHGLTLLTESNPEWQYENLRLYPVVAEAALANSAAANLRTLSDAMKTPGFRVLERKKFGSGNEAWYHGVTVQNKTQDTVFLMAGDVVTGGNQDRVMAFHDIVLPGTVKNVEVFCVEAGRSHYYDQSATQAEKSVGAFKGYYNVASPQVRHAVQSARDQSEVWAAVAKVTKANGAESGTNAYAALDNASEQKARRDAYLNFFNDKITNIPNVVGVIAVSGDKVLGADIFGDSGLFKRQFSALLHGYVAETAMAEKSAQPTESSVQKEFQAVARLAHLDTKVSEEAGRYAIGEHWVHLYKK
jgi:hypothetical protein